MATTLRGPTNKPVYWLVCVFLASLSIKALQEIGGIRILSTFVPALLLLLLPHLRLRIPLSVKRYVIFACLLLPTMSVAMKQSANIYEAYFLITVMAAVCVLTVCVEGLKLDLIRVMRIYADIMVVLCLASVFTVQVQWFGGFSLRGFSDFATFFALQISVGVPFLAGRFVNLKRVVCLIILFFMLSRLSLVLSLSVILIQLHRENRHQFYRLSPLLIGGIVFVSAFTSMGSLMAQKFENVFTAALGGSSDIDINPSDLGRLAYASVTLGALDSTGVVVFGHGIKTNRDIINSRLDTSDWGLDDDLADAAVHNVYLEILSDSGVIGVTGFVAFLGFALSRIFSRFGPLSAPGLAITVFAVSYLFEGNYVSFFFQFFMCYFLWLAGSKRITKSFPLTLAKRDRRQPEAAAKEMPAAIRLSPRHD